MVSNLIKSDLLYDLFSLLGVSQCSHFLRKKKQKSFLTHHDNWGHLKPFKIISILWERHNGLSWKNKNLNSLYIKSSLNYTKTNIGGPYIMLGFPSKKIETERNQSMNDWRHLSGIGFYRSLWYLHDMNGGFVPH